MPVDAEFRKRVNLKLLSRGRGGGRSRGRGCQGLWWALKDLNLRPTDYESAALTAELRALSIHIVPAES